jgi:hypothetical protein
MSNTEQLLKVKNMLINARVDAIGLDAHCSDGRSLRYKITDLCIDFIDAYELELSKKK